MRISKGNLLRVCYSKVSHHHWHPGRDSKACREVRKFYSREKEKASRMPGLKKLLACYIGGQLTRREIAYVIG